MISLRATSRKKRHKIGSEINKGVKEERRKWGPEGSTAETLSRAERCQGKKSKAPSRRIPLEIKQVKETEDEGQLIKSARRRNDRTSKAKTFLKDRGDSQFRKEDRKKSDATADRTARLSAGIRPQVRRKDTQKVPQTPRPHKKKSPSKRLHSKRKGRADRD